MKKWSILLISFFFLFLVGCEVSNNPNNKVKGISFDTMGGYELAPITEIKIGDETSLPIPSKDGYVFVGWCKTENCIEVIDSSNYVFEYDVTLYAKWEKAINSLTIKFDDGNPDITYLLSYGVDVLPYLPVAQVDYCYYEFDIEFPYTMPGKDVVVKAKLTDIRDKFIVKDNVLVEYLGEESSVTIPSGYYFNGKYITIDTIGEEAFYYITKLERVFVPSSIKTLKDSAFYVCKNLSKIILNDGLEVIENSAFNWCNGIIEVNIPKTVRTLSFESFDDCENIEAINVHEDNEFYSSIDGNVYSKDRTKILIYCVGKKDTSFTVPNGVVEIGENAFYYAEHLVNVTLPDTLVKIDKYAFCLCLNLKDVNIPSSVKTIEYGAFYACYAFKNVVIPNGVEYIGDSVFFSCEKLQTIFIPESVTFIGRKQFVGCYNLVSINVDENNPNYKSVDGNLYSKDGTVLYNYTMGKENESFDIPYGVITVEESAFHGCGNLKELTIAESVQVIKDMGIFDCYNLISIVIPASVTSIGNDTLLSCDSLKEVIVEEDNPNYKSIDGNLYSKDGSILLLYAPGSEATRFEIPECVTTIGEESFYTGNLKEIIIHEGVVTIERYAFLHISNITIYCRALSKPETWTDNWNSYKPVVWGYTE